LLAPPKFLGLLRHCVRECFPQLFLPRGLPHVVFRDCDVHVTTLQLHVKFADVGADINEDTELTDPYLVSELFKAVGAFLGNKENALGAEDENALQDVATTEPTNLSAVKPMVAVNFNTVNEETELTDPYLVSELFKAVGAFLGNKANALGAEDENALQDVATTEPTNLSAVKSMVAVNFNTVAHLLEDAVVEMTSKHRVHYLLPCHTLARDERCNARCMQWRNHGRRKGEAGGPWPPGFWND